ncbi:LAMI_0E12200g1_1 [Lachancea mirantina]|uniref:LAMI_0E12200g1_1 n=1 Tax=Lachancea mirantina TaxID=1230905 RepID=A0A1G4JPX0_9SACH|nr:LAMI_0E12200g1_1 [Lachancea mirantina]
MFSLTRLFNCQAKVRTLLKILYTNCTREKQSYTDKKATMHAEVNPYDVIIVGGGVFGLSTAAQCIRRKKAVLVIDKYNIPSPLSAANDYNKIIRLEYDDRFYTSLAIEACDYWNGNGDELLPKGLLHDVYSHCGRISIVPPKESLRYAFEKNSLKILQDEFKRCLDVEEFQGDLTCGNKFPQLHNASVSPDQIRFNADCGIGYAAKSLTKMKEYCVSQGVQFLEQNGVSRIIPGQLVTVETASGQSYKANKVLISCGANSSALLPLQGVIKATGLYVGHINLTLEECKRYANIPVVFNPAVGYFFPPDMDTRTLKICVSAASTYDRESSGVKPRYRIEEPTIVQAHYDSITAKIQRILKDYLPDLLYSQSRLRDIVDLKICWISDSANSDFVIDRVPGQENVYVSCGDSGHAFKFLPNIGRYIWQRMEGNLTKEHQQRWQWRESVWTKDSLSWRMEHQRDSLDKLT